jgi:hypothetical protein
MVYAKKTAISNSMYIYIINAFNQNEHTEVKQLWTTKYGNNKNHFSISKKRQYLHFNFSFKMSSFILIRAFSIATMLHCYMRYIYISETKSIPLSHIHCIHDRSLPMLNTCTLIKNGGVKLALQTNISTFY